jgi:hypothetical protein
MSIKSVNPYVRNIKTFEEITDDQAAQLMLLMMRLTNGKNKLRRTSCFTK